jgi:hypothetical protein
MPTDRSFSPTVARMNDDFEDPFSLRWVQLNVLQDVGLEVPPLLNFESP